ncbi:hypothetical protein BN1221_01195c [Brenneria goodwinii]|uniref:Uncharacterized protein n=1 Tax=Brenneria goodwinii TaxID=1109412 RepID=A0A0G4JS65_9GAMM|nr:hypothetical protein BN1221_01195c [Brenneria goodwinii]
MPSFLDPMCATQTFFTEAERFRALSLLCVVGKVGEFIFRPQLAGLSFRYV